MLLVLVKQRVIFAKFILDHLRPMLCEIILGLRDLEAVL